MCLTWGREITLRSARTFSSMHSAPGLSQAVQSSSLSCLHLPSQVCIQWCLQQSMASQTRSWAPDKDGLCPIYSDSSEGISSRRIYSHFDLLAVRNSMVKPNVKVRMNKCWSYALIAILFITQSSDSLSVFQVLGLNENLMNIKHATHSTTEVHLCPIFLCFIVSDLHFVWCKIFWHAYPI